jgi:hypothetical protein
MKTNHSPYPQSRQTRTLPGVVHAVALGLAVFTSGLVLSTELHAQSRTLATGSGLQLAADAPDSYTVKRGDTLWDIAKTFLNQPWYWPELWYLNPQIQNPHLIYPGDVLKLVSIDGQTRLTVASRGADAAAAGSNDRVVSGGVVRLSPQVRTENMGNAINTISYKDVAAFLGRPSVISPEEVKSGPYLLAPRDARVIAAAGDEYYIAGLQSPTMGARYNVMHVDSPLKDPETGDVLGYHAFYVGSGPITAQSTPAKMQFADTAREALAGDRVFPEQYQVNMNFQPHAPSGETTGVIFSVNDATMAGRFSVVAVNRGAKAGLEAGHVLAIYRVGRTVKDRYADGLSANPMNTPSGFLKSDVKLPDERIGTAMVFKTYERMSYALVMDASEPVNIGDRIANP